jgi:PD-(D/E)XK nuclease superfamily
MNSLLPWSYTKLTTFERCPKLGRARYITKTLPYIESEAAKEGNRVHDAIEHYVKDGVALPSDLTWIIDFIPSKRYEVDILSVERWFNFNEHNQLTHSKSWFTAKIDLLQIENGDIAWIIDWKTGKPWEDPNQLNIYSTAVKAHYPKVRHWRGMYVWLKLKKVGEVHTLSPGQTFLKLVERVKVVETGDIAKKNKLCDWCDLEACKFWTGKKGN